MEEDKKNEAPNVKSEKKLSQQDIFELADSLSSGETMLTKEISSKISSILKYNNEIRENMIKELNMNSFININSDIVDFCSTKCNPYEIKENSKVCATNCIKKYKEQFKILGKSQQYYSKKLRLNSIYFSNPENEVIVEEFAKANKT